jgi:threonine synthase
MPFFKAEDISALKDKTFGQTVADMLNLFFGTRLTAWDVECGIGRFPIKVVNMGQKVVVAEYWRNLDGSYDKMERQLAARICNRFPAEVQVTSWLRIAIRIALLTATYGEMQRQGMTECVDIAVAEGDFTVPMAVWYARLMGLPIANIICSCSDGSDAWNLLYNGQVRTQGGVMQELERLIYGTLGIDEAIRFRDCCQREEMYAISEDMLAVLRCGIFPAVVSADRTEAAIPNVYRTNSYILEQGAATAYSGLMDYRAKERQTGCAMLMADCNPADHAAAIASALNISDTKLKELLE